MKIYLLMMTLITLSCKPAMVTPETMPDDFAIEYNMSGGMINTYRRIKITAKICTDEGREDTTTWNKKLQVNKTDLEKVYKELRALRAFTIPYKTEKEVYDRGGESLRYTIQGKEYTVSDNGLDFVDKNYAKSFGESISIVLGFVARCQPVH